MAKELFKISVDTDDVISEYRDYFADILVDDYGVDSDDTLDDFERFLVREAVKPNMYGHPDFYVFAEGSPVMVDEIWTAIHDTMHQYMTQKADEFFGSLPNDLMEEEE